MNTEIGEEQIEHLEPCEFNVCQLPSDPCLNFYQNELNGLTIAYVVIQ